MINVKSNKNQKINTIKLVEILFYALPLSFIIGNLVLSANLLLFIVISLLLIKREQLACRFNNSCWLLIAFFLYFFLSTTIQFQRPGILSESIQNWSLEENPIFKSFLQIRFIILIFIVDTLFVNKILNLKKLFLSSLLCTSFVSFDVILQHFTGSNLFSFKSPLSMWSPGPFRDELIAGSYLQKFSFFSIFYIFELSKNKNFNSSLLIFTIVLHLVAILLSGNRMPMILFLFGCVLIILFIKNLRFTMSIGLLIFMSLFFIIFTNDIILKKAYRGFFNEINIVKLININKNVTTKQDITKIEDTKKKELKEKRKRALLRISGHNKLFRTSIIMWKEQPLLGFGLKSFRIKCAEIINKDNFARGIQKPQHIACSNHPHNYYLEFLSEAGIIGTSLLVIFFLILLKDSFNYLIKYNKRIDSEMTLLIPVAIIAILEIWPIKSTGSFFTNWGATFFWLDVAILIAATTKKSH